jgi:integrase
MAKTEHHEFMDGKLHVYRRENSDKWQCSTFLKGRNWRVSTREDSLALAKDFAEDWYLTLRGKSRAGQLKTGKTFKQAAAQFEEEYEIITEGERSTTYVEAIKRNLRVHLLPFFGDKVLTEITPGLVQEYRVHRASSRKDQKTGETKRPARNTLHQEIVTLRHVLKTANRHGWLPYLPDLSTPYKASGKISHRAWFSHEEYKRLYQATRERAKNPKKERWRKACETLHDYVLFMVNTGLRPDEASRIEFRDVAIVTDEATGERILEIEVRGKRGVGYCKSMPGAVTPFWRVKRRMNPEPATKVFGKVQNELLNAILTEQDLKFDRNGRPRTAYSLRHTYICFRLMEGADIYQIAKNCRTSVEMIEKYYAAHIKNVLDAAAINVRRPKPSRKKPEKAPAASS